MSTVAGLVYFVDAHLHRHFEVGRLLDMMGDTPKGHVVIVDGSTGGGYDAREDLRSLLDACAEMLAVMPAEACRESGYDARVLKLLKEEKHANLFYSEPLDPIVRRPGNARITGLDIRRFIPRRMA